MDKQVGKEMEGVSGWRGGVSERMDWMDWTEGWECGWVGGKVGASVNGGVSMWMGG